MPIGASSATVKVVQAEFSRFLHIERVAPRSSLGSDSWGWLGRVCRPSLEGVVSGPAMVPP